MERGGIREAEHERDVGDRGAPLLEVAEREVAPYLVEKVAIRRALFSQASMEGPGAHGERARDRLDPRVAAAAKRAGAKKYALAVARADGRSGTTDTSTR